LFIYLFLVLIVAFLVLLERKILGLVQIRKRPNIVRFFRLLQTVADGIKLIIKNFILIKKNFFVLFVYSPILAFFLALFNFFFFFLFYTKTIISYVILFNLFIRGLSVYSILGSG